MIVDEIEIAWIEQHRKVAGFVAVIAALMFAGYAAVDWLLAPELLGRTLPWRVLGGALCLLSVLFVKTDALHKWAPLQMSVVAGIVTVLVSVIFLGILRNPNVALTAQMQVMMAVMVLASLRTVVRVMIPPLLVSMNAGLWWNDATWQMFAMTNVLLVAASVLLVLVSETAYRTFVTRLALERTLQLQATIVQNSDEAIIARDLQGRVTSWNPGAERLFGYSEQEMLGQTMSSLSMPDRIAEDQQVMAKVLRGEGVSSFETVRVCKNGARKEVSISMVPIKDSNATLIGSSKIVRDITERNRAERELHEKDARFRAAIETTPDGFWAVDGQGKLVDTNVAYAHMSGYSRDELLTMQISDLEFIEDSQSTKKHIEEVIRNGSATFETIHRRKDGSTWPVEIITTYTAVNGGQFFVFAKDLTERKKAQELTWHQANFDSLTNLPNRALLFDRLSKECSVARRNHTKVALLFADLDGFKGVNDAHGHDAGDQVLKEVARRWLSSVRETDTVARLGGDEFAVVLGGLHEVTDAAAMAENLIDALRTDVTLANGTACRIGVSIGISVFPADALQVDTLISKADAAMYASKRNGRNTFSFT